MKDAHRDTEITIRPIREDDRPALARLAGRDSASLPGGAVLGAWADGELVAARPLSGARPIADPFRPTRDVARLLERRARQLGVRGGSRSWNPFRTRARAALPGSPPGAGGRTLVLDC